MLYEVITDAVPSRADVEDTIDEKRNILRKEHIERLRDGVRNNFV